CGEYSRPNNSTPTWWAKNNIGSFLREMWDAGSTAFQDAFVAEVNFAECFDGRRVGLLPESSVDRFEQPLGHRPQGPGVLGLEEVLDVGIEQVRLADILEHPVVDDPGGGLV